MPKYIKTRCFYLYFQICGVWRRVPREYKRLLREGSLYVALIWGDERNNSMESAISGRINRYDQLEDLLKFYTIGMHWL